MVCVEFSRTAALLSTVHQRTWTNALSAQEWTIQDVLNMHHLSERTVLRNAQCMYSSMLLMHLPRDPNRHALQWNISQPNCEKKGSIYYINPPGTRYLRLQPQIAFSSAAAAQWPLIGAVAPFFQVPSPGTALQSL